MNWKLVWRGMRLAFLIRVPLLVLLVLAALGPLAIWSPLSKLLRNLLDQSESGWGWLTGWGTFLISMGAFLLAYAAVTAVNLILYYGADRFPDNHRFPLEQKSPLLVFLTGTLSAVILMACVIGQTEAARAPHVLGAILGFAAALALVVFSKIVQLKATDPKTTPHPPPYLVFPAYLFPALQTYFDDLYCSYPDGIKGGKQRINRYSQWALEIFRHVGQGYLIETRARRGELKLRSGHVFALSLSIIAFCLYLFVGFNKSFITADPARVPALAFLMLFLNVICWVLAGLTFFFDRYRFPLLWTLAALAMLTANSPQSDHFFRVEIGQPRPDFLTPAQYLNQRIVRKQENGKVNLIFVATPGGGIQAGAWTTQVLAGLNTEMNNRGLNDTFKNSVCFISSVSGGTMGAMIYAAKIAGRVADPIANSHASAIDEVGWGWTQPDFWRAVAPWFGRRLLDRGWALEEKWIAVNHLGVTRKGMWEGMWTKQAAEEKDIFLADWARMGIEMPALVFNSMLAERGQHVVFSTTDYPPKNDRRGIINFYHLYPGNKFDIRVATAARLSASFPYVAPAARPEIDPYAPGYHFVDGGYYDNDGVDSLIGWLTEALDDVNRDLIGDILILQIRHFNPDTIPGGSRHGWLYQSYAPLSGLLAMWGSSPAGRNRNELELFRKGFNDGKRQIWTATVKFESKEQCAPLSWKLSPHERRCIDDAWRNVDKRALDCVRDYLQRPKNGQRPAACEVLP